MGLLLLWKGGHLKRDCLQASKPPPAPCLVCKGPHWKRDCPQRRRSLGSHRVGHDRSDLAAAAAAIRRFPFRYWGNFVLTEAPGPLSSQSASIMGLSGRAKRYYFSYSLSCNWDSVLFSCAVSDRARISLTPFGKGYT